tara:strand:+ start:273 stop:1373 length:1101 start_codon:yes stop_codon:yes gene_type:complete
MSSKTMMLKARTRMLMEAPFFGALSLKLKLVEDDTIQTLATDGVRLLFSPKFIEKLTPLELIGGVAHEVMHCVLNHHTRRGERDPHIWNVACDLALNPILVKSGFILPKGALNDPKYHDMSAEQIYNLIYNDCPEGQKWGFVLDSTKGNDETNSANEADWQIAVTQAAEVARQRGMLSGDIEEAIADIVAPLVDWCNVLWPFFTSLTNLDYSWRKPHRGYISEDEYLPSMYSEQCGPIAICRDTSGSTYEYQEQFCGELNAVVSDIQPEKVVVVQTDYVVQEAYELEHGDKLPELTLKGNGGTAFYPTFEYLNENYPDLEAIVYLTDLESDPDDFVRCEQLATCPVLWVCTNKLKAPFGATVQITL